MVGEDAVIICGYCEAEVTFAEDGWRHLTDPPVTLTPGGPGDWVTPRHRAGTKVQPADVIDEDEN